MMNGTREEFDYVECSSCGTVQIAEVPDLARFYPEDYYSLAVQPTSNITRTRIRRFAAPRIADHYLGRGSILGRLAARRTNWVGGFFPPALRDPILKLSKDSKILDFGCGSGQLLRDLACFGFTDLTGADAFIARDLEFLNVRILKRSIDEVEGEFDLVMLHHSFEHLPDPAGALSRIRMLTADTGTCLIRIPIAAEAWKRYGVNWFQLDAPRHLFLFTEPAFRGLAKRAGFEVVNSVYDSDRMQFIVSEQYARDISMFDERAYRGDVAKSVFTAEQIESWTCEAEKLNAEGRGDQACFYLRPAA
jgi:SAM-dependent methyltransferase